VLIDPRADPGVAVGGHPLLPRPSPPLLSLPFPLPLPFPPFFSLPSPFPPFPSLP